MLEFVEWQLLTQEWAKALSKARIKEAVIADRMNSFLKGNGCLPTLADLDELEALWQLHLEKRNALNQYIAKVVQTYSEKD
ncbi:MAG: hypothetical protein CTY33_03450 [Methylotenera sp.]|nr:MAG: hypothetical protein CTY33_03450 [Methylotenera sp.]